MTKDDIIPRTEVLRMAREASPKNHDRNIFFDMVIEDIEHFAALVASAERERLTDAAMKAAEKAVNVAIALEREACAQIADQMTQHSYLGKVGQAIRARGEALIRGQA